MMSDYERHQRKILGLQVPWDNYVTPTGPSIKDNHEETNGWGNLTAPVDWAQVEYDENRRNQSEAHAHLFVDEDVDIFDVDDKVSVFLLNLHLMKTSVMSLLVKCTGGLIELSRTESLGLCIQ